jgi:hypothetical protein
MLRRDNNTELAAVPIFEFVGFGIAAPSPFPVDAPDGLTELELIAHVRAKYNANASAVNDVG